MHTKVIKCRKFRVELSDERRPDPIRVTVIGKRGGTGSHHMTTTEVQRLAVALVKAKGIVESRQKKKT